MSFTAVVTDEDALLAAYGVPATTDTVRVCETWTGNDYIVRETTASSTPNAWRDADTAQTVLYNAGQITGYAPDGGAAHAPIAAGPTAFDFMQVDAATRQASYDGNPYYAVYSSEDAPCGGQIRCSVQAADGAELAPGQAAQTAADTGKADKKFAKHGLKRRGVRALVDDAQEVGRSAAGHRRFRKQKGDAAVILTLDKDTELLVGEETTTPEGTTKATHTWKKGKKGGYARERTTIEVAETIGGQPVHSRTTIDLLDVTVTSGSTGGSTSGSAAAAAPSASFTRAPR